LFFGGIGTCIIHTKGQPVISIGKMGLMIGYIILSDKYARPLVTGPKDLSPTTKIAHHATTRYKDRVKKI
jgi:hypothetical protein